MEKVKDEIKKINNNGKSLIKRIFDFESEMINVEILKSREGYGYCYADLPNVIKIITPYLIKHGIGYFHQTSIHQSGEFNILMTTLFCIEDETDTLTSATRIAPDTKLAKMNAFMVEGSAITYFRRYHLTTMLGLTTDEDSDAGGKRTKQKPGRSVEAAASQSEEIDYIAIFKNLVKTKEKIQVEKTFKSYKNQLSNDNIKEIEKLINDNYEN